MGFGKNMVEKTVSTRLFHKTKLEWLEDILNENMSDRGLCCSTEDSENLFAGRDLVVVFTAKERTGMHDTCDADSGNYHGYDEFRLESFSKDEIEKIIVDQPTYDFLDACANGWDEDDEIAEKMAEYLDDTIEHYADYYWDYHSIIQVSNDEFYNF